MLVSVCGTELLKAAEIQPCCSFFFFLLKLFPKSKAHSQSPGAMKGSGVLLALWLGNWIFASETLGCLFPCFCGSTSLSESTLCCRQEPLPHAHCSVCPQPQQLGRISAHLQRSDVLWCSCGHPPWSQSSRRGFVTPFGGL